VGSSISITITVRVDNDVPAGTLLNVADVTAPGDTPTTNNHGEAITTVGLAGLGDFVWWDQNHDGLQSAGEPGFGGVTVHLYDGSGTLVGTTTTDANGFYRFDRLRPGTTYAVCFWKPAAIGDRVWEDTNHNGIQDEGEHGVGGVGVALHDSSGATIAHAVTDANGLYLFDRLPPGTYNVCFEVGTIPSGFGLTTKDAPGSTRANGSDAGADGCAISTVLAPGQRDLDWDAGIWKAPASGGGSGPSTPAKGNPKLTLKKVGKPATVRAGEAIHYTLVVKNVGKATAHGVKVCDTLPDGLTVTSTGGGKLSGAQ